MSYWVGSFLGATVVLFVEMLILMYIIKSISCKKKLGINVEVAKHSLIAAIILGLLANTVFTPALIGQFVIFLIILAVICWLI